MRSDTGARTALAPAPRPVLGSDPHDFAGLYIRHRSSFTSHARRYLRDPRDADEVVQEAFLRLFLAMPELETELQALAYCRRTITNLCIDRYRADARRPRLVALEGAVVDELAEDDSGDPVVRAEDAALVREALSKLPQLHRAALVMREIEEKPLQAIADELEVAEDSVKHLLFRARRALRKLLAGTSVAPGADAERMRGLKPVARGASGGAAGLLLLALLGLGSGPDLRAVPVVGVDLPDVLGVTVVADAVGGAVRDVVGVIVGSSRPDPATVSSRQQLDAPLDRSDAGSGSVGSTPSGAHRSTSESARSAAAAPGAAVTRVPAFVGPDGPGQPVGGRPVTSVTGVGSPTVNLLPPRGSMPGFLPLTVGWPSLPEASFGHGPGPLSAALPSSSGPGRSLPATAPLSGVVAGVEQSGGSLASGTSGRSLRADDAAQRAGWVLAGAADRMTPTAADRAADLAERAQDQAEKAAEKAQKAAEKAADKAEQAAEKVSRAAREDVARAAEAAEQAAERAADRAGRAADRAPARTAERTVVERAGVQAAAQAAARIAEQAAAQAVARAAEQAAAQAAARIAEQTAAQAVARIAEQAAAQAAEQAAAQVAATSAPQAVVGAAAVTATAAAVEPTAAAVTPVAPVVTAVTPTPAP